MTLFSSVNMIFLYKEHKLSGKNRKPCKFSKFLVEKWWEVKTHSTLAHQRGMYAYFCPKTATCKVTRNRRRTGILIPLHPQYFKSKWKWTSWIIPRGGIKHLSWIKHLIKSKSPLVFYAPDHFLSPQLFKPLIGSGATRLNDPKRPPKRCH